MNIKQFSASIEPGVYTLYINDAIGTYEIQGSQIANEIIAINNLKDVKRIDMIINSEGGSIIDGVRIASAMADSKVTIRTINKGYAVSMAAVLYLMGDDREMVDFGLLMIHNPQMGETDMNDEIDPKQREVMFRMKKQLLQLITMKCNSIPIDKLSKMMDSETWLNCDEAMAMGLVDKVISYTDKKVPMYEPSMGVAEYMNKIKDFNSSIEHNNNNNNLNLMQMEDLKKQYEARLSEKENQLKEITAKHNDQVAALKNDYNNLVEKHKVNVAQNDQLKEENNSLSAKIKEYEDAVAIDVVNQAIKDGKFIPEKRAELIEKAKNNIDSFKSMISMIPGNKGADKKEKPVKLTDLTERSETINELNIENLGGLTHFEWLQKNDSNKLADLKDKQPNLYEAMKAEYVNKYKHLNK